jgi:surface protein
MAEYIKAFLGTTPLYRRDEATWVRPADWLPLPAAPVNGVTALHAVFNNATNLVRVRFRTSDGSPYTVDWGDGTVVTVTSNVSADHNYVWNNVSSATVTSQGYRQAVVTITGAGIDLAILNDKHGGGTGLQNYSTGWLDMNLNLPDLISGQRLVIGGAAIRHGFLERVNIASWGNITTAASMFYNCSALRELNSAEWNTSNITSFNSMFFGCIKLQFLDASTWNTSLVIDANSMLRGCSSLVKVDCADWNTSSITNFFGFALADYALAEIDVSNWDMSSAGTIQNMFNSCHSLKKINIGNWALTSLANANGAFASCFTLQDLGVTSLNLPVCTNVSSMFDGCSALPTIGAINVSAATNAATLANNCSSLRQAAFVGINASVSFANCMLSATELNAIYTALSANGAGKTITVSGNFGTATDDPAIATAKGWSVSG